jgi:hypothetical protein
MGGSLYLWSLSCPESALPEPCESAPASAGVL